MNVSRYQKRFGVGLVGAAICWPLFGLLWLLGRSLDHAAISSRPESIQMIGWVLIGVWVCWHVWSVLTIRSWWNDDKLCTSGPYRFVRHPIYAGGALVGFGLALILNSWILLLWPIVSYFIWSALVRREEKMMEAVFGEAYKRYAARTGRLLPRLFENSRRHRVT